MGFEFVRATKEQARLRLALVGVAGSGKTFGGLAIGTKLVPGGRVAVIDTEHGSASKYSDEFEFDTLCLDTFAPATYVAAIRAAEKAGYDVVIIDSLSHAWSGKDGALEMKDAASKRSGSGNSFTAWRDITPQHNAMVEAILQCSAHVIVTMRAKTEYVQEKDSNNRTVIRKVGLAPVQRDGLDYEFDVVMDITTDHDAIVGKTRCRPLTDKVFSRPGEDVADILRVWLTTGKPMAEKPRPVDVPNSPESFAVTDVSSATPAVVASRAAYDEPPESPAPAAAPDKRTAPGWWDAAVVRALDDRAPGKALLGLAALLADSVVPPDAPLVVADAMAGRVLAAADEVSAQTAAERYAAGTPEWCREAVAARLRDALAQRRGLNGAADAGERA